MTHQEQYSRLEEMGVDVKEIKKSNPTEEQLKALKNGILKLSEKMISAEIVQ